MGGERAFGAASTGFGMVPQPPNHTPLWRVLAHLRKSPVHPMENTRPTPCDWPYPRRIAHRGAGRLAPENTLAAFRLGAGMGWRMFECDAKLSADGVVFLLHDDTLDRTTNGHGPAAALSWSELRRLDAGGWHSPGFAGEAIPTLASVARFSLARGLLLNIEIKPCPTRAHETGTAVAREARRLWSAAPGATPPLLSSFEPAALEAARAAAPELPRGLLLQERGADWLPKALALGCGAVIAHHTQWAADAVREARAAALRTLAYTVNDIDDAQRLEEWGLDGLITDWVDLFAPD